MPLGLRIWQTCAFLVSPLSLLLGRPVFNSSCLQVIKCPVNTIGLKPLSHWETQKGYRVHFSSSGSCQGCNKLTFCPGFPPGIRSGSESPCWLSGSFLAQTKSLRQPAENSTGRAAAHIFTPWLQRNFFSVRVRLLRANWHITVDCVTLLWTWGALSSFYCSSPLLLAAYSHWPATSLVLIRLRVKWIQLAGLEENVLKEVNCLLLG